MSNRVDCFLRYEEHDGEKAHECKISARAVFCMAIDAEDENTLGDKESQKAALCGLTNPEEFIERICDTLPEVLKAMTDDEIPVAVWYAKLVKQMAKSMEEKIDDKDKRLMNVMLED